MRRTVILSLSLLVLGGVGVAEAGWEEGVAAFKAKNYTQAAKEFQEVVQQQPDWANGHRMLGQTLLMLNRNQEALTQLRKAYDLNPSEPAIQLVLAKAYLETSRFADAAQLLGQVNQASLPKDQQGVYHQMLAVALEKSGQSGRALQSFEQAARVNPNDADAQFNYGTAAFNAGDTTSAITALEKAARLDARDVKKKEAYLSALIRGAREASGSGKQGLYAKAITVAQDLAGQSATYDHLVSLGEAQLGARDYDGAADTFSKATGKNSADWLGYYYLGQAQTLTDHFPDAEASLKQALQKTTTAKNQQTIWKQIGFVYEKMKKYPEAKLSYTKAGDAEGAARVEQNQNIAAENAKIEEQNRKADEVDAERKRLEEELKKLPGGGAPPPHR